MPCPHDPFREARASAGVLPAVFAGEAIPLLLRHEDVRRAARDWQQFSSDAPFRVPIPSEEDVRRMRQLPIETDPPEHTEYRQIIDPIFRRPALPDFIARVEVLVENLFSAADGKGFLEVVRGFALPLQSRALTYLLNLPEDEATEWIEWGVHVFRDGGDGTAKGMILENYLNRKFDQTEANPSDDAFSDLNRAVFQERPLTREEKLGFGNLIFAGGRDTVIQTVATVFAHLAQHPADLERLRADPKLILTATEEFVRVATPLTQIGRVCPVDTPVGPTTVKAGDRISLCWAAANFDDSVFDAPEEVRLNRRPNPHLAFGSGIHLCPGAAHARLIVRSVLRYLCTNVKSITLGESVPNMEMESAYQRQNGYDSLTVRLEFLP